MTFKPQDPSGSPLPRRGGSAAMLIDYLADFASLRESVVPETARLCNAIRLVCSLQNLVSKKRSWHAADDVSLTWLFSPFSFFPPRSWLDMIQIPSEAKAQKSALGDIYDKTVTNYKAN